MPSVIWLCFGTVFAGVFGAARADSTSEFLLISSFIIGFAAIVAIVMYLTQRPFGGG
jgi:hypothetical protein